MLGRLLRKELVLLLREPGVRLSLVLPFIIYLFIGYAVGGAVKEAVKTAMLENVSIAFVGNSTACGMAKVFAETMRVKGVNATAYCSANPLKLLQLYPIVVEIGFKGKSLKLNVYIKASLSKLLAAIASPEAIGARIAKAITPRAGLNVSLSAYVLLNNRLWVVDRLRGLLSTGQLLSFALLFIAFPASSIAAAVMGAEREEKMIETILSLPVPRRYIAIAKASASLITGLLMASSAIAGILAMYAMMPSTRGSRLPLALQEYGVFGLTTYIVTLVGFTVMLVALSMALGLLASTQRSAQTLAGIVSLPYLLAVFTPFMGGLAAPWLALAPYFTPVYVSYAPLLDSGVVVAAVVAQLAYAIAALIILAKMLESEIAVSGPETVKQFLARLRSRRKR